MGIIPGRTTLVDLAFLGRGFLIGLAIAAPVGPIGVLCIRRTLGEGRLAGFVTGLGAATADALYGAVAALGLTVISRSLVDSQVWLRWVGGLFLCYLGVRTFAARPSEAMGRLGSAGLIGAYVSTFVLTLTNPMTILSFAAIFAGLGALGEVASRPAAAFVVLGVFLGSGSWWLGLSLGVGALRQRINPSVMRWINRAAGALILGFGCLALLTALELAV